MRTLTLVFRFAALSIACGLTVPSVMAAQTNKPPAAQLAQTSSLKVGDHVRAVSGGALMTVRSIEGGNAICEWQGEDGTNHKAAFPPNDLVAVSGTEAAPIITTEPEPYRPCPADVVTAEGRHECIDAK